jgi:RNA polymerase sigma factor (sigma-70 family)
MAKTGLTAVAAAYHKRLLRFVRRRIPAADEAEDIVQEIFYQLSRVNTMAKPVEQTAAWLFRVARNMIINWNRKKRAIPFAALSGAGESGEEAAGDVLDTLSANELTPEIETLRSLVREEIESALDELPAPQRAVFVQTELWGLPVKEIARKTGVPVTTLLSRKHRAVVHLRKKLEDLYDDVTGRSRYKPLT